MSNANIPRTLRAVKAALILVLAMAPATVFASNDIVVVEKGITTQQIPFSTLLSNDEATQGVTTFSDPERGLLTADTQNLYYTPYIDFWEAGSDSFFYWSPTKTTMQGESKTGPPDTVFLIADPSKQLLLFEDFDYVPSQPQWPINLVGSGASAGHNTIQPIRGTGDLLVGFHDGSTATVEVFRGQTSGQSGKVRIRMGPSFNELGGPSDPIQIAYGYDEVGQHHFALEVRRAGNLYLVSARARNQDASWLRTEEAPVEAGNHLLTLWWWSGGTSSAEDGGVILSIDGTFHDSLTTVQNHGVELIDWDLGAIDGTEGYTGQIHFDDLEVWEAEEPPRFGPQLADTFNTRDFRAWDQVVTSGAGAMSPVEVVKVTKDGRAGFAFVDTGDQAFLESKTPQKARRQRVRFELDPSDLKALSGSEITVLVGAYTGKLAPFRLVLQRELPGFTLSLQALVDPNIYQSLGSSEISKLPAMVEIFWWSGRPSVSDGGAQLWVDGALLQQTLSLENAGETIESLQLGNVGHSSGVSGLLYIDDVEVWR